MSEMSIQMRRRIIVCSLLTFFVSSAFAPLIQESQPIEAFRTVVMTTRVRVVNTVNVRSEPSSRGGDATVMLTAQPGEEFPVRQGVEWSQIGSFTWVPVEVNRQNAWIAQEGFLSLITEPVQVPISQAEIDLAVNSPLPENAVEIVAENNELHAVDEHGRIIGAWDWGDPPIQKARWLIAATRPVEWQR
jgi:hypothetical protein